MYTNRISSIHRSRNGSRRDPATRGLSPSPKRRSLTVSTSTPKLSGDYQVLRVDVETKRQTVHKARAALADSLDRLGEHHVRQKEYDDAMDSFAEALHEKRSIFSHLLPSPSTPSNRIIGKSPGSVHSSSFFGPESSSVLSDDASNISGMQDRTIDQIVLTLRNMGNVHSLRGEQDEAMRYYTEVTSLRAQKSSGVEMEMSRRLQVAGTTKSDDNSALMSEISEDVKALDDLFQHISFRNQIKSNGGHHNYQSDARSCKSGSPRRRSSSKALGNASQNQNEGTSNKRRKACNSSSKSAGIIVENEPFKRTTASILLESNRGSSHELQEAMAMYRKVLESHEGPRAEQHKEYVNSFALRADLIVEKKSHQSQESTVSSFQGGSAAEACSVGTAPKNSSCKAADLELSLEIYRQILNLYKDEQQHDAMSASDESLPPASSLNQQSPRADPILSSTGIEVTTEIPATDTIPSLPSITTSPSMKKLEQQQQIAADMATVLICMGSIYYKLGNRLEELNMYTQAKSLYSKTFGDNHVYVAGTRKNIGMVMAERGEYEDAIVQFEMAKEIYLSLSDNNELSKDVASAISCMGNVKNRVGELDAALTHYMEALKIYKSIHEQQQHMQHSLTEQDTSKNDEASRSTATYALRDVTSTLKVIGMVHAKKGDLDTAMRFFQEAMSILLSSGLDDTSIGRETTASVLTRIASIHLKKSDLEQAMAHYREAYDLTVRNRGTTNHPEVAGILHYIGGIYHKRSDYDEAMACYQEGIRIYHATLGPGNPTVAGTLVMVGSIHYKKRNFDSAMMFYREALRLNRDAYGLHHPDVAPILKSIGTILTKQGSYQEAYDIFRDVLSIKCTVHGTGHAEVASAYKSLGNVHYKMGDLADAERQYRHALSIYRRTKGEQHADTVAARTTIEHLRYWMREREQMQMEQRHSKETTRSRAETDERSC